jgi:hypothetical protein
VNDVLIIAVFVLLAALLAYQVYLLAWAKKTVSEVPKTVTVLRVVNIVVLVAAVGLVAFALWGRG